VVLNKTVKVRLGSVERDLTTELNRNDWWGEVQSELRLAAISGRITHDEFNAQISQTGS
jgi:hypothetical protein